MAAITKLLKIIQVLGASRLEAVSKALGPACQGWVARVALSGFPALGLRCQESCLICPPPVGNLRTLIRLADSCGAHAVRHAMQSQLSVAGLCRFSLSPADPRVSDLEPVVAALKEMDDCRYLGTRQRQLDPGRLSVWNQKSRG